MADRKFVSYLADFFQFDFFLREFKKYAHFGGRTGRKDFWVFILTTIMIYIGFAKMALLIEKPNLLVWFEIVMFSPVLASVVRRLHDVGKSGYFIPFCMTISVCIFLLIGFAFQKDLGATGLLYLAYGTLFIAFYPFFFLFKKTHPNLNKYDTMPSHPYRHGILAVLFILFFYGIVYLLQYHVEHLSVLPEAKDGLSTQEIDEIDKVIQKYQKTH